MARPTIQIRISFINAPFDAIAGLTWIDISAYVWLEDSPGGAPISITRGRQFELDKIQAGTMTLVLDNRDRRFDPDNASSPYAPNVIPTRRINLRATYNAVTYDLFTGYVESWVPKDIGEGYTAVNVVTLTAVDLLKTLNYTTASQLETGPNSAAQVIGDVLNTIGWPAADRIVGSTPTSTQIPAQTWGPAPALTTIQTVATADGGSFFIEDDGRTAYHDRYWATRTSSPQALFGDASAMVTSTLSGAHNASVTTISLVSAVGFPSAGTIQVDSELISYTGVNTGTQQLTGATRGAYSSLAASHLSGAVVTPELPYVDVQFSFDDTRLINHAEVTRAGGTVQVSDDAASQATYDLRGTQVTGLQITTDAEALSRAQYLTILYAQPYLRVQSLILNGDLAPAVWPQILARTFDDKIVVIRRPPGGGNPIAKPARIEAMNQAIGATTWLATWQVYPVGNDTWLTWDDPVTGRFDSGNRWAY